MGSVLAAIFFGLTRVTYPISRDLPPIDIQHRRASGTVDLTRRGVVDRLIDLEGAPVLLGDREGADDAAERRDDRKRDGTGHGGAGREIPPCPNNVKGTVRALRSSVILVEADGKSVSGRSLRDFHKP